MSCPWNYQETSKYMQEPARYHIRHWTFYTGRRRERERERERERSEREREKETPGGKHNIVHFCEMIILYMISLRLTIGNITCIEPCNIFKVFKSI